MGVIGFVSLGPLESSIGVKIAPWRGSKLDSTSSSIDIFSGINRGAVGGFGW